jgi:colicin import membrane protein
LLTEAQKKAVEDAKAVAEKLREENKEKRMAAQKALAERQSEGRALSAEYNARYQKLVKEAAAKKKAAQEQAKEAKSKPAPKDSAKEAPKTPAKEAPAAQTQPEKK